MDWPGRFCRARPKRTVFVSITGARSGLAEAAGSPRRAAGSASAAATAATAASASSAAAATTTATATAAAAGFLHHAAQRSRVLLVEHIESRQADVGDFFFTEIELLIRYYVARLR